MFNTPSMETRMSRMRKTGGRYDRIDTSARVKISYVCTNWLIPILSPSAGVHYQGLSPRFLVIFYFLSRTNFGRETNVDIDDFLRREKSDPTSRARRSSQDFSLSEANLKLKFRKRPVHAV